MKRRKTAALVLVLALGLCGCTQKAPQAGPTEPAVSVTEPAVQSTYTVDKDAFPDLLIELEEKINHGEEGPWDSYTIGITGFCTPVVLALEELEVRSATVYGRTMEIDFHSDEACIMVTAQEYDNELIILNGNDSAWVIAPDWEYAFLPEKGVSTYVSMNEQGQLTYYRAADYLEWLEHYDTALLDSIASRWDLYQEEGILSFQDGQPSYEVTQRTTVSDLYDLDALFAEAKDWGEYEQYDTLDDLLAANKARGIEYPSYPAED